MTFRVKCAGCGRTVKAKDDWAGKTGRCPGCGNSILFPKSTDEALEPRTVDWGQSDWEQLSGPTSPQIPNTPVMPEFVEVSHDHVEQSLKHSTSTHEETVLSVGDVRVTTSRVIISGTTYALRNITSVKMGVTPANTSGAIVLIVLGALAVLLSFGLFSNDAGTGLSTLLIGATMIAIGVVMYRSIVPKYHLVLSSSSGESHALTSEDKGHIARVVDAVNEAIVRY